jgi:hypothetical protein
MSNDKDQGDEEMMLGQTEWSHLKQADLYREADQGRLARQVKQASKTAKQSTPKRRRALRRLRELPTRN